MIIVPTNPAYMSGPNVVWIQAYNGFGEPIFDTFSRTNNNFEQWQGHEDDTTFGSSLVFDGSTVRAFNTPGAAVVLGPIGRTITGQNAGGFALKLSVDVLRNTATVFLGVGPEPYGVLPLVQIANGSINVLRVEYTSGSSGGALITQSVNVSTAAMVPARYSVMRVGDTTYSQWYVYAGDTQVATFDNTIAGGIPTIGSSYYFGCTAGGVSQATLDNLQLEYGVI